jgi:hypothetical protein
VAWNPKAHSEGATARWYLTAPTLVIADALGAIAFVLLMVVGINLATTSTAPTVVLQPPQVTRVAPPADTATPINTSTVKQTVTVGPEMPYFLRPGG